MPHISCPFCGAVNEATVRNDVLRPGSRPTIGPVWTCMLCEESWTDAHAEALLDYDPDDLDEEASFGPGNPQDYGDSHLGL